MGKVEDTLVGSTMGKNSATADENATRYPSGNVLSNKNVTEKYQGNSNTKALSPYRTLIVSDTFAGTGAFSKDNFVGLAEHFKQANEQKANAFVYLGGYSGLIPWIPQYEQQNQLKSIKKGINFMSSAPAIIKPPFERLINEATAPDAEVYAIPGIADSQNIDAIAKDLRIAYSHRPKWLRNEFVRTETSMEGTAETIKNTKISIEALNRQLEKHPDDASLISEYENAKQKLKLNEEEYAELGERKKMLKTLAEAHIERLSTGKLKSLTSKLKEELKEKEESFKHLKNENGTKEEYEKVAKESKAISNLLRAANKRLEEFGNLELGSMAKQGSAHIEAFTHNVRIKPDIEKIINKLAKMDYYSYVRNFDSKHRIVILDEDLTFIPKKLNGFEFTMVLKGAPTIGTSAKMHSKTSNTKVTDNFYSYVETAGKREVLQKPLTMLISGGHIFTSLSIEPTFDLDREKLFLSLAKGPFADRSTVAEMLNKKIVTRTTKAVEKLPMDSSASILDVFPNGEIVHTSLTSEFLKIKRIEADRRELAIAQKLIGNRRKKAPESSNGGSVVSEAAKLVRDKALDELILQQRLPSELKPYEVSSLSTKQILKLIPHAAEEIPTNIKKLGVVAFSDVHWGGWAEVDLLDKSVEIGKKYIHSLDQNRTPILLLNGDIIEGNLANFKNSPAQRTLPNTYEEYRTYLQNRGLTTEQVNVELDKFSKNVSIIQTISSQAESVVLKFLPIIDEVISKGGYIIIDSGNHFNNTDKRHEHDEATEVAGPIKFYLKGKGYSEDYIKAHIIVVTGEEYGIGNIQVDDDNVVRVQHKLARVLEQKPQAVFKKRLPVAAVIESHYHEPKETITGDLQTFETPAMQYEDENTYVSAFPQAISDATRGFAIVEVDLKDNRTIKSTYKPVLRANLERNGELENSLYHAFRNETFSIKTLKNGGEKVKI